MRCAVAAISRARAEQSAAGISKRRRSSSMVITSSMRCLREARDEPKRCRWCAARSREDWACRSGAKPAPASASRHLCRGQAHGRPKPNRSPNVLCFPGCFAVTATAWSKSIASTRRHVEPKVVGSPDGIAGIFDRDEVRGIVLAIQESGDAKHPVAVGASGIAAEGDGEQLERLFLLRRSRSLRPAKAPDTCRAMSRGSRSELGRHPMPGAQRAGRRHPCRCRYRDGERMRCTPWCVCGCQGEADWQRHRCSRRS